MVNGFFWPRPPKGKPYRIRRSTSFLPLLTNGAHSQLVTKNRKKELVAELHKAHRFIRRRKGYLAIAPAGLTMLDQIVVSLVYVEKTRREKRYSEDEGDSGGGDGGGDGGGGGGADGGGGGGS